MISTASPTRGMDQLAYIQFLPIYLLISLLFLVFAFFFTSDGWVEGDVCTLEISFMYQIRVIRIEDTKY